MRAHHIVRAVRVLTLIVFAAACGLLLHRLRRTPEQQELSHYVQVEIPSLFSVEAPIERPAEVTERIADFLRKKF